MYNIHFGYSWRSYIMCRIEGEKSLGLDIDEKRWKKMAIYLDFVISHLPIDLCYHLYYYIQLV